MSETCQNCGHRFTCDNKGSDDGGCKFDESHWTSDAPEEEFFIVAGKRDDGKLPPLGMAIDDEMYHARNLARGEAQRLNKHKDVYRVYRCVGRVVAEVTP